jgi:LmbE family N-acetylglucosaminyl deacetylase
MELSRKSAEIFVPDASEVTSALERTTHLAVASHQDDIEIMAFHGILECFGSSDEWFTGVTVTNGSGSPRKDIYGDYSDEEMQAVRKVEQKKASIVGEYSAMVMLDHPSSALKDPNDKNAVADILTILASTSPQIVYTHNLADKHDTHVAVALRTIEALRKLPEGSRPAKVFGCEVWRGLDWMCDEDKVVFDVSPRESLASALLGVFDSQICGGKRYDLATLGRRRANATFFASHGTDDAQSIIFGVDMTPLITDTSIDPLEYARDYVLRFADEVSSRIKRFQ